MRKRGLGRARGRPEAAVAEAGKRRRVCVWGAEAGLGGGRVGAL